MASSIGGGGGVANIPVGVVSNALPLHSTRADDLQDSMQQLMVAYGIRGVSTTFSETKLSILVSVDCKMLSTVNSHLSINVYKERHSQLSLPPSLPSHPQQCRHQTNCRYSTRFLASSTPSFPPRCHAPLPTTLATPTPQIGGVARWAESSQSQPTGWSFVS